MKKLYLFVLLLVLATHAQRATAQNISNEGTEFWTVFPTHVPNTGSPATMNINVTSRYDTEVIVSCGTWNTGTKPIAVPANTVVTILVDRPQSYIEDPTDANKKLVNRGIHIVVPNGKPKIVAYSHVFASARSAATLILPVEALGQQYYSMNYTQDNTGKNFLAIIAAEDATDLILHKKNGTTINLPTLNKGDVYEYLLASEDLTGTFVETAPNSSCKKFAAFSGSSALRIGGSGGGIDPLIQQLYAVRNWGKTYGVVPFIGRRYIVRVLAQENGTAVLIDGTAIGVINKGQYLERVFTEPVIVSSDKLISVAEYSFTQEYSLPNGGGATIGDPEMVLLNPVEFNIRNITLFASSDYQITEKYLNVFMKTDKSNTFKINGQAPSDGSWQPMPNNPAYSYRQILVTEASLTLTADDGFNAIAYGFGVHESYAYSAGTNLASSQFLTLIDKATNKESATACINQTTDFKVTMPYILQKIVWKLGDGDPDYTDNSPVPTIKVVNGETLYTYTSPVNKKFTTAGQQDVVAIATLSVAQNPCNPSTEVEIPFPVQVDPLPIADFEAEATGCTNNAMKFTDKSDTQVSGRIIKEWVWDFDDPSSGAQNTSGLQNPTHTFIGAGLHKVKLSVKSESGCASDVKTFDIIISYKPVAGFQKKGGNYCVNTDVALTNTSTIASGTITNYHWDFGPEIPALDMADATIPSIKFPTAGKKAITLTVTSDKGCTSDPFPLDIEVFPLPKADFLMPGYCREDGAAVFTNLSVNADGTTNGLTYEWNFGDGSLPSAVGQHVYQNPGRYTVTLRVFNQYGCEAPPSIQEFIVNPFLTKAEFTIDNENNLCSGKDVVIHNTSTIASPGRIVKIEIYKDYLNDPASFITIDYPGSEDIALSYPKFGGSASKTFQIHMVAYSGASCFLTVDHSVTIKPSPILVFDNIPDACEMDGSILLTQARETTGIVGKGVYSGPGITNGSGLFNTRVAGVGLKTITYTYVGDAPGSCPDFITQQILVKPSPRASSDSPIYMLAEGEVKLTPTVSDDAFTYSWSPSAGLDKTDVRNPIAKPTKDTEYTLVVTNSVGCTAETKIKVIVLEKIEIPSSFSPNGDNVNDVWNIKYLDTYPKATVEIYNRNGSKVYSSYGYKAPFDGNFQNQPLPVGVYYYIINPRNGRNIVTGAVTIIR